MSPPNSEPDLDEKIKAELTAKQSPQRSRWLDVLAVVATSVVCLITAVVFVRYDLLNQVTTLQGLLDSTHRENAERANTLSRQKQRIAELEGTMGQIDLLSAQLIENLSSLRELSSGAIPDSLETPEVPAVSANSPEAREPIVESDLEVQAAVEVTPIVPFENRSMTPSVIPDDAEPADLSSDGAATIEAPTHELQ